MSNSTNPTPLPTIDEERLLTLIYWSQEHGDKDGLKALRAHVAQAVQSARERLMGTIGRDDKMNAEIRKLAESKLLARIEARDAYIKFLSDLEQSRAGIIVTHPHFGYKTSDIERGQELRDAIEQADALTPKPDHHG